MEIDGLIYEKDGRVARLTLNRPQVLNALDYPAKVALDGITRMIAKDDDVRVVAIRGTGRAFCTGVDLKALSTGRIDERNFSLWEVAMRRLETMDKIVLCLMHGHSLGGGVQFGLACDLRVTTPTSKFGLPAAKEGLVPGLSIWRLARTIGMGRAKELALWGNMIDGTEAHRIGLVTHLVSDENRDAEFEAYVDKAVGIASQGARATKQAMSLAQDMDWQEAFDLYMGFQRKGLDSDDFREAMAAYREGRDARWR